jgi:hypothetical protein
MDFLRIHIPGWQVESLCLPQWLVRAIVEEMSRENVGIQWLQRLKVLDMPCGNKGLGHTLRENIVTTPAKLGC